MASRTASKITSKETLTFLWTIAKGIGKDKLGFEPHKIGVHLIQSGGAMTMYLTCTPVYTIMLLGHKSSDAFLLYIQKQVQEVSVSMAKCMVQYDSFYTIPDIPAVVSIMALQLKALQCFQPSHSLSSLHHRSDTHSEHGLTALPGRPA